MPERKTPHLPIGYWLKKADELLTARINEAQRANGLSRTEWQILNVLHETPAASRGEIIEVLHPFGEPEKLGSIIDGLVGRGLVEAEGAGAEALRLTEAGRALHRTALEVQQKVRERAVRGISEADYVTTVRVLQQMVKNLTDEEG